MTHPTPPPSPEYLAAASSPENRTNRVFALIDPPSDPPPEVQARSREFTASVRWTLAKTMVFPHEYIVRAKVPAYLRDGYDRLWADVQIYGFRARFGREVKPYLAVNGWKHWSCVLANCGVENWNAACPHAALGIGCVVNRSLVDDPPPAQLSLEVGQ